MSNERYDETFNTWNKVAKLYEGKFMGLDLYDDTYDLFCSLLPAADATVLELGCGPGNITRYLLAKIPGLKITAIDTSENMISLAKENVPAGDFYMMDSRDISRLAAKFNGIIAGFCLPYLSSNDVTKLLHDAAFLLQEDGIIYLSFVEGAATDSGYKAGSTGDRTYFYYHPLEEILTALVENNFEKSEVIFKKYTATNGQEETHTIVLGKKIN